MNAALALKSVNMATELQECVSIARNSIESGSALEKLKSLIEVSGGDINKLNSLL
jgi:anthranilate phosphoribosyltransferase